MHSPAIMDDDIDSVEVGANYVWKKIRFQLLAVSLTNLAASFLRHGHSHYYLL